VDVTYAQIFELAYDQGWVAERGRAVGACSPQKMKICVRLMKILGLRKEDYGVQEKKRRPKGVAHRHQREGLSGVEVMVWRGSQYQGW